MNTLTWLDGYPAKVHTAATHGTLQLDAVDVLDAACAKRCEEEDDGENEDVGRRTTGEVTTAGVLGYLGGLGTAIAAIMVSRHFFELKNKVKCQKQYTLCSFKLTFPCQLFFSVSDQVLQGPAREVLEPGTGGRRRGGDRSRRQDGERERGRRDDPRGGRGQRGKGQGAGAARDGRGRRRGARARHQPDGLGKRRPRYVVVVPQ